MLRKAAIAGVFLTSFSLAHASDWHPIAGNNDGTIEIDLGTVSRNGPLVKVWLRQIFSNGKADTAYPRPIGSKQTHWYLDCKRRAIAQGEIFVRDMQQDIMFQSRGTPNDFQDVVPDSTGEAVLETICAAH
ncbi:surface-adhesin E family protein [Paraburkholderia sabiae]|uniref:Surface-adhesin E family protein n=1 Tax=Paraburkholderia sabiae TaxID=273251 RepID=A0ABU9QPR0_9BURK|nr:surface-adhesin E family protein [Paraburkholderia sabiae]WJZ74384.1 hypothetical protein QEN71_00785 [Paraburkholderia sabiae]CAD6562654.1 hypothetical protein LMG24235_07893 [Paraburkholderia sabiae]